MVTLYGSSTLHQAYTSFSKALNTGADTKRNLEKKTIQITIITGQLCQIGHFRVPFESKYEIFVVVIGSKFNMNEN